MNKAQAKDYKEEVLESMTKAEREWASSYQKNLQTNLSIEVVDYFAFEPMTFKLAPRLSYTPDFLHFGRNNELYFIEVKASKHQRGYQYSLARMKTANEKFPMFHWIIAMKNGGDWKLRIL